MPRDRKDVRDGRSSAGHGMQDDYIAPGVRQKHYDLDDEENPVPDPDDDSDDEDEDLDEFP